MCHISYRCDDWAYDPPSPSPRPVPQLAWAVPVDILELVVTLQAYSNQLAAVTTLRLCHRSGTTPLSTLPQEILDQIIAEAQEIEKRKVERKFQKSFKCFQGICKQVDHYEEHIEVMWQDFFGEPCDGSTPMDPDDFSLEEKADMIDRFMEEDQYSDDGNSYEVHTEEQENWVHMVCLCDTEAGKAKGFVPLNNILKEHFGLEAIVLHEAMSSNLKRFLPRVGWMDDNSYYTSSFLTLVSREESTHGRIATSKHKHFLKINNHLAYHKILDPSKLDITKKEQMRFARAMRMLHLKPAFHITELESLVHPDTDDSAFWEICDSKLVGYPQPADKSRNKKLDLLREYINQKNLEIGKESWPKFMSIATSDVVTSGE